VSFSECLNVIACRNKLGTIICTVYIKKCANNLFAIKGKVRFETRAVIRYFGFKKDVLKIGME
jgi:hypothetical protein